MCRLPHRRLIPGTPLLNCPSVNTMRLAGSLAFFMRAFLSQELLPAGQFSGSAVLRLVDPACCSLLSRHGEGVSPAWHRQNIARALRIELHLLAQVVNMRFDQTAISPLGVSPHAPADDARCQHLPWMRNQQMEQAALGRGHFHFALTTKDFMAQRIKGDRPTSNHG